MVQTDKGFKNMNKEMRTKWGKQTNKQDRLKKWGSTVWLNFRIPVRESGEKNGKLTVLQLAG